jgi:BirA family transcriptional regulator, biotin operon repressor / biotin---[acetyl-CoA-carboxylase] ligase
MMARRAGVGSPGAASEPGVTRSAAAAPGGDETPLVARVFARLADGRFHSGEELAEALGVSRSAVWKAARQLREQGAVLHAVRNRGYRLPGAGEPLDASRIRERLAREARERVQRLEVVWSIGSTNTALSERAGPAAGSCEVLLAECQTAGRGRRGRSWLAPPGAAICLSLSWTFREVPSDLGALGLVVGVCALRALRELGVSEAAALKWPNDLLVGEEKLGGVLIDLRAESAGPASVVIGIGLNVALGSFVLKRIAETGTPATDLRSAGLGTGVSRNEVAAGVVAACVRGLLTFEKEGLKAFLEEWRQADALRGRQVNVAGADGTARGVARGIDLRGALLVETRDGIRRFVSGDVTVRAG